MVRTLFRIGTRFFIFLWPESEWEIGIWREDGFVIDIRAWRFYIAIDLSPVPLV